MGWERRCAFADGARPEISRTALYAAITLAKDLARFPQQCLRGDRLSSYGQWSLSLEDALVCETRHGMRVVQSGETLAGPARFAKGAGRHGAFE